MLLQGRNMLPVNLLNALKQYAVGQKTLPKGVPDAVAKSGQQFELGQKVQGTVQTQVATNLFKVSVSGQLVQMELPPSVHSGDTVALQVIALQPKLAFSMVNSAPPLSTPEQLGATAKMLSSLSQQSPDKAYVRAAQSTPLWPASQAPESKQLAGILKEALSNSGLFYESHQAQWLDGGRTTAQLLAEPQNLSPEQTKAAVGSNPASKAATANKTVPTNATNHALPQSNAASDAPAADDTGKTVQANNKANPVTIPGSAAEADTSKQSSPGTQSATASTSIPDHLQPLVQQQLNALETSQLMWQGNVWPGQEMQWEVHEQAPRSPSIDGARQWVTQIQMDLPNLGPVAATLRLNSMGLSLTLNADTDQTRSLLGNASSQLVATLADAGITVLSAQVAQ